MSDLVQFEFLCTDDTVAICSLPPEKLHFETGSLVRIFKYVFLVSILKRLPGSSTAVVPIPPH